MTLPSTEVEGPAPAQAPTRRRAVVTGVLAALLVACLAALVWGQVWLHDRRIEDDRKADVLAAAKHGTSLVLSYDYRRLAAGGRETKSLLTGAALKQFQEVQAPLVKAAPGLKAVVSATVKAATVLDSEDRSARVLLFVDQTSTSTKLTAPRVDQSRIVVNLTRSHGDWLISSISAV
jgi:Mce-associated membrane protein